MLIAHSVLTCLAIINTNTLSECTCLVIQEKCFRVFLLLLHRIEKMRKVLALQDGKNIACTNTTAIVPKSFILKLSFSCISWDSNSYFLFVHVSIGIKSLQEV